MRKGENITNLWHRIWNLFSRRHSRRATDKVWAVKVCVSVCVNERKREIVTLTTMKFVLHRFTYHPFLPTLYREAAKAKTPPKSHFISQNFSFCSSLFRDIKLSEESTELISLNPHRNNSYHLRRFWWSSRPTYLCLVLFDEVQLLSSHSVDY